MLKFLRVNLSARGYQVYTAVNGAEALLSAEIKSPDIILLDLNLPGMDGFEVLYRLRECCSAPVLVVSARSSERDKVLCLDKGADDYILKPFGLEELLARVRVLLRRTEPHLAEDSPVTFKCSEIEVDFDAIQLRVSGKPVELTSTEYRVLKFLVTNAGKILTHNMILSDVWGSEYRDNNQYTHVIINRLRKKIEQNPSQPVFIQTVPGIGYRFRAQ